jgi:hypothetical protein
MTEAMFKITELRARGCKKRISAKKIVVAPEKMWNRRTEFIYKFYMILAIFLSSVCYDNILTDGQKYRSFNAGT